MVLPRTSRLIAALVLGVASQLPMPAEDNAGEGVRPADQVVPKEHPRLQDNEVVSLKRRLEVHGGMSFTYGWASGGRNFREAGAWVSYFDPETGLGLAVAFSRFSGDGSYDFGYNPYGYYDGRAGRLLGGRRSAYDVNLFWTRPNFVIDVGFSQTDFSHQPAFDGSGSSLHRHF